MSLLKFFFFLPEKEKFTQGIANEQLIAKVDKLWGDLDELSLILLLGGIAIGVLIAIIYYTAYNEMPGRHYKVKHWGIGFFVTLLITLLFSAAIEYFGLKTSIKSGLMSLYCICALNSALYSLIAYLLVSFIWCNCLPTNAYKFLKL